MREGVSNPTTASQTLDTSEVHYANFELICPWTHMNHHGYRMGSAATLRFIIALLCFTVSSAQNLTTFTGTYGSFNQTMYNEFEVVAAASITNGALQLTPDSPYRNQLLNQPLGMLQDQSGRVVLKQPFKLWDNSVKNSQDRVASFNSFLINAYAFKNITAGEGLAFVVAPDLDIPSRSEGQYLGLTNYISDGNPANQLVAVELDTFKEAFDPDANHVGLNINSIVSNITTALTPLGIEIALLGEDRYYNVWVQYDGVKKFIEVYIERQVEWEGQTPPRPPTPVLKADLDLRGVVAQHSYFGFSGSTGSAVQLNCVLRWNLTVEYYPQDKNPLSRKILILGIGVGVGAVLVAGAVVLGYYLGKKRGMSQPKMNIIVALKRLPGTPREFKFRDLKKATNNFDENKLGQGGFGVVYRGYLKKENQEVAVKWFSMETIKGQDDFLAELTIINRLRHKYLVPLLGKSFSP
ncbi:hypothetical protein Acr_00g0062960 [Actinidia rufa]|uniref:Protein kinase domain-containing protein n=1 Tax=Actinidia rufa TaxID=165716 RepID=A0A7J0DPC0_9ERIC|nr:hypothetical protein Acr_00g0062960 [Actinidia rufa]